MSKAYGMISPTAERYTAEEYQKYVRPNSVIFNLLRNTTHMKVSEVMHNGYRMEMICMSRGGLC